MNLTFPKDQLQPIFDALSRANAAFADSYPGDPVERQPVHVVYGGAHLFKAGTQASLARNARDTFSRYLPTPDSLVTVLGIPVDVAPIVHDRIRHKLETEPVEDYRIDFEDGYGQRPDDEEDKDAVRAARELRQAHTAGQLPPFIGLRVKPLTQALAQRSVRTLDLFLTAILESGEMPRGFLINLPKITVPAQVKMFADLLSGLELRHNLPGGSLRIELMIETPQALQQLDILLEAARGRCFTLHFGAYDYMTACNISGAVQTLSHPAANFARQSLKVAAAQRGVFLSDGATTTLPIAPHRGADLSVEQQEENCSVIHRAMRLHYDDAIQSLQHGFYQGWDLHPAQIPTRYAAVYTFFLSGFDSAARRLKNFVAQAAQATRIGEVFDDAATAQGLLNYLLRALSSGAITEEEAIASGLTADQIRRRTFLA